MFLRLKARVSYWLARRLFHWSWLVRQPRGWSWMEGQFARMANLGDVGAQSFYGHILAFRGQGLGAREEGVRLLRLAALAGDGKAWQPLALAQPESTLDSVQTKTPRANRRRMADMMVILGWY